MSIKPFPRTRQEPQKRILLIPVLLIVIGMLMTLVPVLRFFGSVVALAGTLCIFLVGMVFADLWTSARRTKQIIKAREDRMAESSEELLDPIEEIDELVEPDPFEESFED